MSTTDDIPIQQLLDALLDEETPLNPRFLYRFSDLSRSDLKLIANTWQKVPVWRRQAVMEDLEELGENDSLLSFEAIARLALRDDDPKVRLLGVRSLWEYEERDLIPLFLTMFESDGDVGVRAAAASALGRFVYLGELEELPERILHQVENSLLRSVNSSDDPEVRRNALESLGFSSRDEVVPLIESAYNSGDKEWLATSLFAMGRSANERWISPVLEMLTNPIPSVRAEAVRAAGELEISDATFTLIELLQDPNESVRTAAIWSLSQIGGEGVRESLEEMQDNTDDEEEAEYLDSALDNLAFTEDMQLMPLFNLPDESLPDEEDAENDESYFEDLFEDDGFEEEEDDQD